MKWFTLPLILFLSILCLGAGESGPYGQYNRFETALVNPGFENGKFRWTNSGSGTFAITTTAANVGAGAASASWDAAANNDALTATQVTIPSGLYGQLCQATFLYKGGDANITAQVIDGAPSVVASLALSTSANFTTGKIDFTCPTSGTFAFKLLASANAAVLYLDSVYIGLGQLATVAGVETFTNKTFTTPVMSSPTVRGDLLLQNTSGSQPTLQLSEDPDNGTDKVIIQSPATLGGDYTLTLPVDDGSSSQVLSTDGSGLLSWATVATTVTTTRGDMIRRGAATDERFSASTDNRVVRGDGTDAVSGQIDDPDFFTTGAAASASDIGIVTTAAQSFAGLKKFQGGLIQVSSVIATDANATLSNTDPRHITFTGFTTTRTVALPQTTILAGEVFTLVTTGAGDMAVTASGGGAIDTIRAGHITLVALQAGPSLAAHWRVVFLDESVALSTTFTPTTSGGSAASGSTVTGSVTLKARRWGSGSSKQVSVLFPATTTTDPGSNAVALVQTTALPTRFASNGSIGMGGTYPVRDNAGGSNTVGLVVMGSDAKVYLYRNYSQSLFTDNAAAGVDTAVAGGGVSLTFFNDP